jgi:hypothetical protein
VHDARRELPEDRLPGHGRKMNRLGILDGLTREGDLDAAGFAPGAGHGEEDLGSGGAPLGVQQVRQLPCFERIACHSQGRTLARGRPRFVKDPV